MDPKLLKTLGVVAGGMVIFIVILMLVTSCSKGNYDFSRLQDDMIKVAKTYYEANKDELPQQDKDTKSITLKKMISNGDIRELSELFGREDLKCDGSVTVTNNNGYYLYSPYLSCDDEYETEYLSDVIIENSLVEEGVGLYSVNDEYIMKGEVKNNFVSMNGNLYRIMRINEDGTIRLFELKGKNQVVWDDRYNPDINFTSGINEFYFNSINSRVKDAVEEYYNDATAFPDEVKAYITTQDLCVGKRTAADITKNGSAECSQKIEAQPFALLTAYEYLQTSLDSNCNSTTDYECRNYNWFSDIESSTWTMTADAESSRFVFTLYKTLTVTNASSFAYINPIINLSEKAIYVGGTGTETDPYTFR